MTIVQWGDKWACDDDGAPINFIHESCGHVTHPKCVCDVCNEEINAKLLIPEVGSGIANKLDRGELKVEKVLYKNLKMPSE